ncbi:MAG TPA: CDP-glucose 4,6-dehydratase, partial [Chthoniobacterales bacterium]|nr:CDP-glucose 4,6-dehydratase [Chthoniobacterales bacterium]
SLFEQIGLASELQHEIGDIRDPAAVERSLRAAEPDFVFHLAAQPLVRLSYGEPVETYAANVMGTVHVLDSLRRLDRRCTAVFVTTDKCYENREWVHSYREEDPLGGYDPYSSSKAAAEIAIAAYRRSFFGSHPVKIASARAGNVIGGGDWALDRIVPDCIRALQRGEAIPVRNKRSTRPWQHVLEPLSGYLCLAARIASDANESSLCSPFNFGPALASNRTVADLVQELLKHGPGEWVDHSDPNAVHEAALLNLATDKAFHLLGWSPVWPFAKTLEKTAAWYRSANHVGADRRAELLRLTQAQIEAYECDASDMALPWTKS